MDPLVLEAASAAWASLSALAILVLGVLTLGGGRARAPGGLAFAGFAILWALHILMGRWMAYAPADSAAEAHLAYLAFVLPLPYLLVQFARAFAKDGADSLLWRALTATTIGVAGSVLALLFLAPRWLYEGPSPVGARSVPEWGPAYAPLVMVPFFLAQGLALVTLDRARRTSTTGRTSMRHAVMAAGLALPVGFAVANNLGFYAADIALDREAQDVLVYAPLFLLLTVGTAVVGLRALVEAAREPSDALKRSAYLVGIAALAPLLWGIMEGALAYELLPRFNTLGLWRLVGVAMLAYAFARWRMPELTPRSRHAAATVMGVGVATAAGGLSVGLFILLTRSTPLILLAGLVVPLATLTPSVRLARRALSADRESEVSMATLSRRLETYRAALEASLARNSLHEDDAFLAALREKLAIGADVHEALLVIARDTVLPPPDEAHPGYERLRLLGEGGQGRAWLARRRADDQLVVLKESRSLDDESRRALAHQAKVSQRVRHPNLVHIHHAVHTPGNTFLVMDHMPGGSLSDCLAQGPLSPRLASQATLDVLAGLSALHAAGYTHGDVKPSNVLLDADGRAALCDYGTTRASSPDRTMTFSPTAGTLAAMAPEQLDGAAATPASDQYAAGALFYRLLTGEHYVSLTGMDELRARSQVRIAEPRFPHPRVPPAFGPIIRRALAKRPEDRYPSVRAMRDALEDMASQL